MEVKLGAVDMAVVVIRPCRSGKEFAHIAIQLYGGPLTRPSQVLVSLQCFAMRVLGNCVPQQGLSERLFATVGL